MTVIPAVAAVTERIIERSLTSRAAYLAMIDQAREAGLDPVHIVRRDFHGRCCSDFAAACHR